VIIVTKNFRQLTASFCRKSFTARTNSTSGKAL